MQLLTDNMPSFNRDGLFGFLDACFDTGITPMVAGAPGVGKSQVLTRFAESRGHEVVHIHLGMYGIHTIAGIAIPHTDKGTTTFTVPDFMARLYERAGGRQGTKPVCLLLDELPNAERAVTAGANQIVHEGRIGDYALPPGCKIIAAGNGSNHGAHACHWPATTANRVAHACFEGATVEEFIDFGEETGRLSPEVMVYLDMNKGALHEFDRNQPINNTHRSWEAASKLCLRQRALGLPFDSAFTMLLSTVLRRDTTVDMAVTIDQADLVVPVSDVVADPESAPLPGEVKGKGKRGGGAEFIAAWLQLRVLDGALGPDGDEKAVKKVKAIATYVGRMSAERRAAFVGMVQRRYSRDLIPAKIQRIVQKQFRDEFLAVIAEGQS